jgi:hypothetical protein
MQPDNSHSWYTNHVCLPQLALGSFGCLPQAGCLPRALGATCSVLTSVAVTSTGSRSNPGAAGGGGPARNGHLDRLSYVSLAR